MIAPMKPGHACVKGPDWRAGGCNVGKANIEHLAIRHPVASLKNVTEEGEILGNVAS